LLLGAGVSLATVLSNPRPEWDLAFLIVLLVGGLLEVRSVEGTRHGPFSCAASLYLAALAIPGAGPIGALVCCAASLLGRLILGPAPRQLETYTADFVPLALAALVSGFVEVEPGLRLVGPVAVYLVTSELTSRALYPLLKSTRLTRTRFALASVVGSAPAAYLASHEPPLLVFLGALLLIGQSGGYMRIRQEALAETSRTLQTTKHDLVQARREQTQTSHQLERTTRERELVENLARYFAQNPTEEQVASGCLDALSPLFPEAESSLWRVTARGFECMGPGAPPALCPPPELLRTCWERQAIWNCPRGESPWILAPLPEEGVLALRLRTPITFSESRRSLLTILSSQFGLGLQSARYRGQLQRALLEQQETNRQLELSQERLVQSGKMAAVGQLAAGVAHELNSPLAAALLQVQAGKLRLEMGNLPKVASSLETAETSLTLAQEIIEKLLNFSRVSSPRNTRLDLGEVARSAGELIRDQVAADGIDMEFDVTPEMWVDGAPTELQQVFVNLLQNARYACRQVPTRPGRITIKGGSARDRAWVIVSDTGPGIPEETAPRIFEPFFTTKPIGEGTGLGLAISFEIVRAHRGALEMRSSPDGASFRVSLPRSVDPA
jgi:two-component system C4-dicarboxylate transport sensor histidine kinase DctB